jgi:hypothetical protein
MKNYQMQSPFIQLPAELIQNILTFVPATSLAYLAQTCHLLRLHTFDEKLWQAHLQQSLPGTKLDKAYPALSFRDLYISHHPYLFLPKYKIWFSDTPHTGKLLIARYSHSRQTVEAYALAAERGAPRIEFWAWKPDVIIHTFNPEIRLDLNQPVLKISPECMPTGLANRVQHEIRMDTHTYSSAGGIVSKFIHARSLQPSAIGPGTQVWPPQTLPALSRVRNASMDAFRGTGHRPSKPSEVSEHAFRLRRYMDYNSQLLGIRRVGEDVSTYATLPPDCYVPTKQKPWRGIWCGDYSGHGCEFLAVLQPDEIQRLPEGAIDALEHNRRSVSPSSDTSYQTALSSIADGDTDLAELEHFDLPEALSFLDSASTTHDATILDEDATKRQDGVKDKDLDEAEYSGQLMAVKLTGEILSQPPLQDPFDEPSSLGDPNIPRGQYTFIAPDISDQGLLRIADEEFFKGARVVRSVGHIAARGYIEGTHQYMDGTVSNKPLIHPRWVYTLPTNPHRP